MTPFEAIRREFARASWTCGRTRHMVTFDQMHLARAADRRLAARAREAESRSRARQGRTIGRRRAA